MEQLQVLMNSEQRKMYGFLCLLILAAVLFSRMKLNLMLWNEYNLLDQLFSLRFLDTNGFPSSSEVINLVFASEVFLQRSNLKTCPENLNKLARKPHVQLHFELQCDD